MIYIENKSNDPFYNQAFEEYVFNNYKNDDILLLWRNSPAVVCGCYQNIFAEVDVSRAFEKGVALVRRMSGGGTVFHDLGNLNYTMIQNSKPDAVDYSEFLNPMIAALRRIGVPVSINRKSDIAIDGLKVSGSAQKVANGRIMHHGTLLYNCDLSVLSNLSNGQRAYFETKGVASVPWPVTNMIDHMEDKSASIVDFCEKLLDSLKQENDIKNHHLNDEEIRQICELADTKYRSWEWTYGKSPSFTYRRTFILCEKEIKVEYTAQKGVIKEISFSPKNEALSHSLTGKRLDIKEIQDILSEFPGLKALYKYIF